MKKIIRQNITLWHEDQNNFYVNIAEARKEKYLEKLMFKKKEIETHKKILDRLLIEENELQQHYDNIKEDSE